MSLLKQSTALDKMVFMTDSADHLAGKTGLTLTITASKNGAAFASISPTVTERGNGWYSIALTSSHTDTLGDLALHVTGTGADPSDLVWQVVAGLPGETVTLAAVTHTGAVIPTVTTLTNAPSDSSGVTTLLSRVTGTLAAGTHNPQSGDAYSRLGAPAGASVSADVAAVKAETASIQSDTNDIQTRLPAALVGGKMDSTGGPTSGDIADAVWDEARAGHVAAGSFGEGVASVQGDVTGSLQGDVQNLASGVITGASLDSTALNDIKNKFVVVQDTLNAPTVTSNTVTLNSVYCANDDAINGMTLLHYNLANELIQAKRITDYNNTTATVTVEGTWLVNPVDTDRILVVESSYGGGSAPTAAQVADAVWDEARADHVSVGSFGEGVKVSSRVNMKKNTAFSGFMFTMYDSTTNLPKTGLSVTAQRAIDGGGYAACANSVSEISAGTYKIDLSAGDLNGNCIKLKFTSSGALQQDFTVVTQE